MGDLAADTSTTSSKVIASDVVPLPSPNTVVEPAAAPQPTAVEPTPIAPALVIPPAPAIKPDQKADDPGAKALPTTASNAPQKLEIQLQNPIEPKTDGLEAKVVIPWVLAVVGWALAIALYRLTRKNKINDDLNGIVIDDIKEFLEKMEELTRMVASHQGGCPCQGVDLRESRKHLTTLRQTAMAVSNRVYEALLNASDREEWKLIFREWKTPTEGNTGWITNKNNKWSREKMAVLEQANEEYTGKIINFRNRIVTRKIKLKA